MEFAVLEDFVVASGDVDNVVDVDDDDCVVELNSSDLGFIIS